MRDEEVRHLLNLPNYKDAVELRDPDVNSDGLYKMARWKRDEHGAMELICRRISDGMSLRRICRARGWPKSIVSKWIAEDQGRRERYDAALSEWADDIAQETLAISDEVKDETEPQKITAAKLRIDTRLRLAGRWDRRRYGENYGNVQINAQAGSLVSILSSLPPLGAPEEIELNPDAS